MFDAHCHLDLLPDPAVAWEEAGAAGVTDALVAGVSPAGWDAQLALSGPGLHLALGLHPWKTDVSARHLGDVLAQLAGHRHRCAAVGETGLDLRAGQPPRSRQLRALRAQLDLARQWNRPVVLHVVRAHAEVLAVVDQDGLPPAGAMVHGFTGSAELAQAWMRRGCLLSVGGPATWTVSRKRAAGIRAIADAALLVETDAPDQAPQPWRDRGLPGRPAMLPAVVAAVARIRGQPAAQVAEGTAANARRLLGRGPAG